MRKLLQKMVLMLPCWALSFSAMAYDVEKDGIYYLIDKENNQAIVTYKDMRIASYTSEEVVIPEYIPYGTGRVPLRMLVVGVAESAFVGCTAVKSIVLPNTTEFVLNNAFEGCTSLQRITCKATEVPIVYTSTGKDGTLPGMQDVVLCVPTGKTSTYASKTGWKGFGTVTDNPLLSFVADGLGYHITSETDLTAEVTYQHSEGDTHPDELTIPTTVTYRGVEYSVNAIGERAFQNCKTLAYLNMSNQVKSLGDFCFSMCSELVCVNLSSGLEKIGKAAFTGCEALPQIIVPNGVTDIGASAFSYCPCLKYLVLGEEVTSVGEKIIEYSPNVVEVHINAATPPTCYGDAFTDTDLSKTTLYVPEASIADYKAIAKWKSFKDVAAIQFHYCVSNIFYRKAKNQTINNFIETIYRSRNGDAYAYDVEVPKGFKMLVNNKFSVQFYVKGIGEYTFWNCNLLRSVTMADELGYIDNYAFGRCYMLKQVKMPSGLTRIGMGAFSDCTKLTEIEIPKEVTTIEKWAFQRCTNLVKVINQAPVPQVITADVMDGVNLSACTLYVPEGCTEAYRTADVWKDFGTIAELTTGIQGTADDEGPQVTVTGGKVMVEGAAASAHVTVYTLAGAQVYGGTDKAIALPTGLYIVKVQGKATKVMVE